MYLNLNKGKDTTYTLNKKDTGGDSYLNLIKKDTPLVVYGVYIP